VGHRREQQRLMLLPAPILSHWLLPVAFGERNDVGQNRNAQGGAVLIRLADGSVLDKIDLFPALLPNAAESRVTESRLSDKIRMTLGLVVFAVSSAWSTPVARTVSFPPGQ
jgi:hypothetical protein